MKKTFLNNIKIAFIVAAAMLATGCVREYKVTIVATNDMHSAIDNFPKLATLVEQLRTENRGSVLLVDAGDRWTGNPFVDLADKPLSPIIELMNELGYDLATLGNHEFDWGQPLLEERISEMDFPVVCANIETKGSQLSYIPPYAFIEVDGVRFAFLGLVTNFTRFQRPEGKAEHFEGLTFPDVYQTAERYAWLRDSCDVFVGLTHIGDAADTVLARRVPQLDLIIGGHSHTVISEPILIGNTLVTQGGSKLKYASVTTIVLKGKKVVSIENHLVPLEPVAPTPHFAEMVERYKDNQKLLTPIGETAAPFTKDGVVNMMTDAIRTKTKSDISLYHIGGVRVEGLDGKISTADLFSIEPFMSEVYTLKMTPGQIKGLVMNKFNDRINPKEAHGPDLFPGGFTYEIVTDEAGEAIDVKFGHFEKKSYKIAMPDYVYKNYKFDRSEDAVETGLLVTEILKEYIEAKTPVKPDNNRRIEIK